ncbi:MAG: GNAT family N-acetyltransferase [Myxococcota bacterium]
MIEEAPSNPNPAERRQLLDVLALAFRDNPMNVAIHGPRPGRRLRANRAGLRDLVLDAEKPTWSRVIRHNGRVLGGLVAIAPGGFPLEPPPLSRLIGCFLHQGATEMNQWAQVTEALRDRHPLEEHWYLSVLGVLPERQGQGVGGRLLAALLERARQDQQPVYLESDRAESIRFYRNRGFEDRAEVERFGVTCRCLGLGFSGKMPDLCDSVREL